MKIKTVELIGDALDHAVAIAANNMGLPIYWRFYTDGKASQPHWVESGSSERFRPSTRGDHAVPIIEQEGIEWMCNLTSTEAARFENAHADWQAFYRNRRETEHRSFARTPLTAAMRRFVTKHLGDEVEVPEELMP
jgi:Protein of unknown function (DUF2591)